MTERFQINESSLQDLANRTGVQPVDLQKLAALIELHDCPGEFVERDGKSVWDETIRRPHWKHLIAQNLTKAQVRPISEIMSHYHGSQPGQGQWVRKVAYDRWSLESVYMCEGGEPITGPTGWCGESLLFNKHDPQDRALVNHQNRYGFPDPLNFQPGQPVRYTIIHP